MKVRQPLEMNQSDAWLKLDDHYRIQMVLFLIDFFVTIMRVTSSKRITRRRLHNTVRKTILSYYSQEEAARVVGAAKKQHVSISNFVASAALKAAEVVLSKANKLP